MEIAATGPSYTVNTLETLSDKKEFDTFFILGTDSLREVSTWKDYERLFSLANFVVVTRPGIDFAAAWAEVPSHLRDQFQQQGDDFVHQSSKRLIQSNLQGLNISATRIRSLMHSGQSIRYLVTESVRSYIIDRKLYTK